MINIMNACLAGTVNTYWERGKYNHDLFISLPIVLLFR